MDKCVSHGILREREKEHCLSVHSLCMRVLVVCAGVDAGVQGIELGDLHCPVPFRTSQNKIQKTMFYCFYTKFKVIDLSISLSYDSTMLHKLVP